MIGLAAVLWALAGGMARAAQAAPPQDPAESAESMKPYTETIPGTDVKFEMLPIPGGSFVMGSPDGEPKREADEGPMHPVKVGAFWMGKFEVTWEEYDSSPSRSTSRRRSGTTST
jgi:formylglycine-generating enzyme required for sulfatase activity